MEEKKFNYEGYASLDWEDRRLIASLLTLTHLVEGTEDFGKDHYDRDGLVSILHDIALDVLDRFAEMYNQYNELLAKHQESKTGEDRLELPEIDREEG